MKVIVMILFHCRARYANQREREREGRRFIWISRAPYLGPPHYRERERERERGSPGRGEEAQGGEGERKGGREQGDGRRERQWAGIPAPCVPSRPSARAPAPGSAGWRPPAPAACCMLLFSLFDCMLAGLFGFFVCMLFGLFVLFVCMLFGLFVLCVRWLTWFICLLCGMAASFTSRRDGDS